MPSVVLCGVSCVFCVVCGEFSACGCVVCVCGCV